MEANQKQTWMPTTIGVLNILAGVFNLIGILGLLIAIYVIPAEPGYWHNYYRADYFVINILIGCAIYLAVTGVLAVIGGIYALKRRHFGLVIAGCIASIISEIVLGITSTVLAILSRKEYT